VIWAVDILRIKVERKLLAVVIVAFKASSPSAKTSSALGDFYVSVPVVVQTLRKVVKSVRPDIACTMPIIDDDDIVLVLRVARGYYPRTPTGYHRELQSPSPAPDPSRDSANIELVLVELLPLVERGKPHPVWESQHDG
jgi:hypothetical protein